MKKYLRWIVGMLLICIGVVWYIYPDYVNYRASKQAKRIEQQIDITRDETDAFKEIESINQEATLEDEPKTKKELYEAMYNYNQKLFKDGYVEMDDAWIDFQESIDLEVLEALDYAIGTIEIPKINVKMPLYLGASDEHLLKGAATVTGTSMPIGGENTHCTIAGHRGWQRGDYFNKIPSLKEGDLVIVKNLWEELTYRVTGMEAVYPYESNKLATVASKDLLTLLTCYEYQAGVGSTKRLLVRCERVLDEDESQNLENSQSETSDVSVQPTTIEQTDDTSFNDIIADTSDIERMIRLILPVVLGIFLILRLRH